MKIYLNYKDVTILKNIFTGNYDVIVFGSRAKGTHKQFSDIDICLKSDKPIPLEIMAMLKAQCSESNLPYKVDIIDYHDLDDSFRKIVDTTGVYL